MANADNNTVAVVDVTRPGESRFQGFVPTGWYPTGVPFDPSGKSILVLSGKGLAAAPNPRGPSPVAANADAQYIGGLLNGALSTVPVPDQKALAEMTARVFTISAYNEGRRLEPPGRPEGSPVPARVTVGVDWGEYRLRLPRPLPPEPPVLRLDVPDWRPANVLPGTDDVRNLGIMIDRIRVDAGH